MAEYKLRMNWPMATYIVMVHAGGIYGYHLLGECSWRALFLGFSLWMAGGLGITAGAHRLWSHRSYKASLPLRAFLMLCQSVANQGSIYHWARDHRGAVYLFHWVF